MTNPIIFGYLEKDIIKECEGMHGFVKDLRAKIISGIPVSPQDLFVLAEAFNSFRFWVSAYFLEAEALYREKLEGYRNEGMSVAGAEAKAKVTPEYRTYNYLKRVDSMVEEQVLLVKKFESRMDDEGKFGGR